MSPSVDPAPKSPAAGVGRRRLAGPHLATSSGCFPLPPCSQAAMPNFCADIRSAGRWRTPGLVGPLLPLVGSPWTLATPLGLSGSIPRSLASVDAKAGSFFPPFWPVGLRGCTAVPGLGYMTSGPCSGAIELDPVVGPCEGGPRGFGHGSPTAPASLLCPGIPAWRVGPSSAVWSSAWVLNVLVVWLRDPGSSGGGVHGVGVQGVLVEQQQLLKVWHPLSLVQH